MVTNNYQNKFVCNKKMKESPLVNDQNHWKEDYDGLTEETEYEVTEIYHNQQTYNENLYTQNGTNEIAVEGMRNTTHYEKRMLVDNRDRQLREVRKIRILISRPVKSNNNIDIIIIKVILGIVVLIHT